MKQSLPFINDLYKLVTIDSIEVINEPMDMIDIEVENEHTFCITKSNLVTHNCNNLVKAVTIPALKSGCSLLIVNHVYDDPGSMFPSKIKTQGGGKGLQYMARITLQCTKVLEKESEKGSQNFYKATIRDLISTSDWLTQQKSMDTSYLRHKASTKSLHILKRNSE
jgi:RecA/RadA recombinase